MPEATRRLGVERREKDEIKQENLKSFKVCSLLHVVSFYIASRCNYISQIRMRNRIV